MLRHYLLLAAGLLSLSALAAPPGTRQARHKADPLNISVPCTVNRPEQPVAHAETFRPKKTIRRVSEGETYTYRGAFQSFYADGGTVFSYSGGDFLSYDVSISINGTTATISNLFNLVEGYPFDGSQEFEITGKYDQSTNTISIPTPHQLDKATLVGNIFGAYPSALICGTVDHTGQMSPEEELQFHINADGTVSTTQNFGAMMYDSTGSFVGFKCIYKGALMNGDLTVSRPVTFTTDLDFGSCYAGESIENNIRIFNLGNAPLNASVTTEGDFKVAKNSLTLAANKTTDVKAVFTPETIGDKHGAISISCADRNVNIDTYGHALQMPDFSYLIDKGEMTFYTGANFPFVPYDADGQRSARSELTGAGSITSSYLRVTVNVSPGHVGTFSWKGASTSNTYYAIPSVIVDGNEWGCYTEMINKDISGEVMFGEGSHTVEFNYLLNFAAFFNENDFMYVGALCFEEKPMEANEAHILTPGLIFPNSLLKQGQAVGKYVDLKLLNTGTQPLGILSVTPSEHFSNSDIPEAVGSLEEMNMIVKFSATAPGQYDEEITIETSAGSYTIPCSALVREIPDFQTIVASGDFTFQTDEQNPFLIENGKAYNSTAKVPDREITSCSLTANFNVPEGYFGRLGWKGRIDCDEAVNGMWTDYLLIGIKTEQQQHYTVVCGQHDMDSSLFPYFEEPDLMPLMCTPGECYVSFNYLQYGDNAYGGEDRVEIYDLSLELIPDEDAAVMIESEVEFEPVHVGKETAKSVTFLNMSTTPLEIYEIVCDGDFYGDCPSTTAVFNQYLNVPVYFAPYSDGHHEATMTFITSIGDYELKVSGDAISTDGIIMLEDFEDDAANWAIYDRDGDGDCWNLAFNVFGGYPKNHVHGGEECVVSFSGDYFNGTWRTFRPDNWTLSPSFEVPADGAWLTWYAAGDFIERPGDIYSVYVAEGAFDPEAPFDIKNYKEVATEKLDDTEWHFHQIDLSEYAGKEMHAAFRHHDSEGIYMVKLDDVVVYDYDPSGVSAIEPSVAKPVRTLYHSADGQRLNRPSDKGLTIVTTEYDNGTVKSTKILK